MLRTPVLTDRQIAAFDNDGCLVPPGAFGTGEMRRLYFATCNRASEGDHMARYYADKRKTYPPDIDREEGREYVYKV